MNETSVALALLVGPLLFATASTDTDSVYEFPELQLAITLPEVEDVAPGKPRDQEASGDGMIHWWNAKLGDKRFAMSLSVFDAAGWALREPGDVTELVVDNQREGPRRFDVLEEYFLGGDYGYAPFASVVVADVTPEGRTAVTERHFVLGGLLEESGYALHVLCEPVPDEDDEALIRAFLVEGVAYNGVKRDPDWTDEEIIERWLASVPEEFHEDFSKAMKKKSTAKKVRVRTDHYLIMTNSSGGKLFAKKMEENYDEIVEIFPFEQVDGRRLMPVFLFRTRDDYVSFHMKNTGSSEASARRSGGFAWKDYYATWYEAPKDPVHIHEQTHQIFGNRLRLGGGGSWFQEGVAEYVETTPNQRNIVARTVRDGDATPLRDLVQLRSLLHSTVEDTKGGSRAGDNYKQASLLIEFLRESDFGEGRFEAFLRTLGKVPRNDLDGIEAGFQKVYGTGIDGIEAEWRAYCKKR